MQKFKSVDELVNKLRPSKPIYCIRTSSIRTASNYFQKNFPGKIFYAVKTNPHPKVLKTIIDSGIKNFDVASLEEIKTVKKIFSTADCYYMNTIKNKDQTLLKIIECFDGEILK